MNVGVRQATQTMRQARTASTQTARKTARDFCCPSAPVRLENGYKNSDQQAPWRGHWNDGNQFARSYLTDTHTHTHTHARTHSHSHSDAPRVNRTIHRTPVRNFGKCYTIFCPRDDMLALSLVVSSLKSHKSHNLFVSRI